MNGSRVAATPLRPKATYHASVDRGRHDQGEDQPAPRRVEQEVETDQHEHEDPEPRRHHPDRQQRRRRDDAPATGLPVEQDQRREPERDGADEPDLHRPEQVLEAAPEEGHDERDDGPGPRTGGASREDVDLEHDDHVQERQQGQVRHVGRQAERPEHQPVDDRGDAEPVLVERLEEAVEADRALGHDRPLVGEERQPAAEPEQRREGDDRTDRDDGVGQVGAARSGAGDGSGTDQAGLRSERCAGAAGL